MKTLDEAIAHAEEVARENEQRAGIYRNHSGVYYANNADRCDACAADHRQLAEWLKELKERREKGEDAG